MQLTVPAIGALQQKIIQRRFALATIMDGLPFDALEKKKKLHHAILSVHPKLQLPTAQDIIDKLLPGKEDRLK